MVCGIVKAGGVSRDTAKIPMPGFAKQCSPTNPKVQQSFLPTWDFHSDESIDAGKAMGTMAISTKGSSSSAKALVNSARQVLLCHFKDTPTSAEIDVATLESYIAACEHEKEPAVAMGIWALMLRNYGVPTQQNIYHSLLRTCCKGGRPELAIQLFRFMHSQGISHDDFTISLLICSLAKVGAHDEARFWLDFLHKEGISPNITAYNALIRACAGQDDASLAIYYLEQMVADGLVPSMITYNALMDAVLGGADAPVTSVERALALIKTIMVANPFVCSRWLVHHALLSVSRNGQAPRQALTLIQLLDSELCVRPHPASLKALLAACQKKSQRTQCIIELQEHLQAMQAQVCIISV